MEFFRLIMLRKIVNILKMEKFLVQFQVPRTSLGERPFITGGILVGKYVVDQTHFHWGLSPNTGTEHALNGRRYDLEMHIVHHNAKYADVNTAKNFEGGIAVIAVLFQIAQVQKAKQKNI